MTARPWQVRLLSGPVSVTLPDGEVLGPSTWRTRKTADLLTLLALAGGAPVPVSRLLGALWPEVEEEKGRASLRTAASTLRRSLGGDCLSRELAGIALVGARIDVREFETLAEDVRRAAAVGGHTDAYAAARTAAELYRADLAPLDSDSDWAIEARDRLRTALGDVLADGAEAAVATGAFRDAVAFAARLLELNSFDERAYRTAMLAYAGLGEPQRAVELYTRCKQALADELGLDPAPQTRAAYLQVLRSGEQPAPSAQAGARGPELLRTASTAFAARRIREGNDAVRVARRESASVPDRAATNLVVAEHAVLVGEAPRVLDLISAALTDLGDAQPPQLASGANTAGLLLLAAHDLGAERPSASLHHESMPTWLTLRILLERGDLAEASAVAAEDGPAPTAPLALALDGLSRGCLRYALGDSPGALTILRATLASATAGEAGLIVPELAARLARVEAEYDIDIAAEHLDLAESALGEGVFARERWAMLLARAAIRLAAGKTAAAALGVEQARSTAASLGLVHLVAEADRAARALAGGAYALLPAQRLGQRLVTN